MLIPIDQGWCGIVMIGRIKGNHYYLILIKVILKRQMTEPNSFLILTDIDISFLKPYFEPGEKWPG